MTYCWDYLSSDHPFQISSVSSVIIKSESLFYYKVRWSVIKKCDNFITKCDDYYEVRQNNVRVSEIWNQLASSPPRSAARVLTSYITTGIRSFLSL